MITVDSFEHLNGLNCSEYLVYGLANYYKRPAPLMFLGSWGGDIDFSKTILDQGFISDNARNISYYLKESLGIQAETYQFDSYDEFSRAISIELENNRPVLASVDLYWVPWTTQNYMRIRWKHAILIVGKCSEGWLCFDYFSNCKSIMPFDHMEKCFKEIRTFLPLEKPELTIQQCKDTIRENIYHNLVESNWFVKLINLTEQYSDPDLLCQTIYKINNSLVEFQNCPFLEAINRLSQRRSQFALALEYLAALCPDGSLLELIECIHQIAASWKSILGMLQKAYLLQDKTTLLCRVTARIKKLSYDERSVCLRLYNWSISIDPPPVFSYIDAGICRLSCIPYDISKYANHKGIGGEENELSAHFQSGFIVADDILQKGTIITADSVYKLSPIIAPSDNIACVGQILPVNARCGAISIISCAEFAHQIEQIDVITDHKVYNIPFYVTAWNWAHPEFEQQVAWKGHQGITTVEGIRKYPLPIYLYSKKYELSSSEYIESIKLPYCPNIHIFAISLHLS